MIPNSFSNIDPSSQNDFIVPSTTHLGSPDYLSDLESDYESQYDSSMLSSSMINQASTSRSRSSVGRKKNKFTMILEKFYTKNSKNPKKEFINAFIIRSIRRFFRNAATDKKPVRTCLAIDSCNETEVVCWNIIREMYLAEPAYYDRVSLTTNAPLTDGKAKRKERNIGKIAKSHNNSFCKSFFNDKKLQKAFFVLMDLLFSDSDPNKLKNRFKFYCCTHPLHYDECFQNWNDLKVYLYNEYFKDLDLTIDDELKKFAMKAVKIEPNLEGELVLDEISIIGELDDFIS